MYLATVCQIAKLPHGSFGVRYASHDTFFLRPVNLVRILVLQDEVVPVPEKSGALPQPPDLTSHTSRRRTTSRAPPALYRPPSSHHCTPPPPASRRPPHQHRLLLGSVCIWADAFGRASSPVPPGSSTPATAQVCTAYTLYQRSLPKCFSVEDSRRRPLLFSNVQ